jgi:hypothetical protein
MLACALAVSACSSTAPHAQTSTAPVRTGTWTAWVQTFCADQSAIRHGVDAAGWFLPDSRSLHVEHRLAPTIAVTSTDDAYILQGAVQATLDVLLTTVQHGRDEMRAIGTPTTPALRNGPRMAAYYRAGLGAVASTLAKLTPVAQRLPNQDVPRFASALTSLRVAALAAWESEDDYWGAAQTLDTSHALEQIMRGDKNCYWLGD